MSRWRSNLSDDVIATIFSYLDGASLARISIVCKQWNETSWRDEGSLWREVYTHTWRLVPSRHSVDVSTTWLLNTNRGGNSRWRALFRNESLKQGWKQIFTIRNQGRDLFQQETRRDRDRSTVMPAHILYKIMGICGLSTVVLLNASLTLCEHQFLSSTEFVLIILFWALVSLITVFMVRSNMLTSFNRILQFGGFSSLMCFATLKFIQSQSPPGVVSVSDVMLAIPLVSAGFFSILMICSVAMFWLLPFVPASYRSPIGLLLLDE